MNHNLDGTVKAEFVYKQNLYQKNNGQPGIRLVSSSIYERDAFVAEYTKRRAAGTCQLCKNPAPFLDSVGKPYLENHHIIWLSKGGKDSIDNTVALCPNCHRKMHIIDCEQDRKILMEAINLEVEKDADFATD